MRKTFQKVAQVYEMITSSEGTLFTNAFAYALVVGIAPFLIIFVLFIGTYVYEVDQVVSLLARYIPADLILPFVEYISTSQPSNLGLIGSLLGVSIWVGSKSIYSFLLLSSENDEVYINHILLRILSIVYLIFLIAAIVGIAIVMGFFNMTNRLLIAPILLAFFTLFYRLTSFRYTRIRDVLPGAISTTIIILLLGQLFFVYINGFTNYQTIYGPLASVMILLISGWLIAWVIFLGYSINFVARDTQGPIKEKDKLIRFLGKY
ncbi:YihY/virulence factor BrkB family protein [Erysipelothrix sp. HDW6C]|uniref:YihY/virulence factor BrkB family protein n=1 Tax=Erysipelothrix sp. HDW6C TaxID=2714930 RepID=UPI00140B6046|nr:YhjD/YihY/BrkB family envelope integrity protein [Erysipelothrix sp. HDW6C]QIK69702.1 YihY/virulence factor BrkB family protein [Erysipelothrix sp. HDW6C]